MRTNVENGFVRAREWVKEHSCEQNLSLKVYCYGLQSHVVEVLSAIWAMQFVNETLSRNIKDGLTSFYYRERITL